MSHHIDKTDTDRWFCIENSENVINVFGQVDLGNVMDTGQPNMQTFLTEDELEDYVDSMLGPNYYLIAVTTQNEMFMGGSQKYPTPTLV